ncbi:hypothetical protein [Pendulispora albinea]|uniref:Uncharacterized protein n=1 Tax=Pendulispora albinea TaxID=2741071 RepID=A0ABZ2M7Y9_9BACT
MPSEREIRQYALMKDKLLEFNDGKLPLSNLIDSLRALLDNVEEVSSQWRESFGQHWWTLEQVYAVALDRGNLEALPIESKVLVAEAVTELRRLVDEVLPQS